MQKLVAFDLDGTLITTASGEPFPIDYRDAQWLPGRLQVLHALHQLGFKTAIVTNQGGVGAGYKIKPEVERYLHHIQLEAQIDFLRVCYSNDPEDPRRKPNPGMLQDLFRVTGYSPSDVLYIGDYKTDYEAAQRAKVPFMWSDKKAASKYDSQDYFFREETILFP